MSLPETKPNPSSSLLLALQSKLSWLSRVWHVTVINYDWSAFDWFPLWHEVNKGECDWCWQILHTEVTELTKKCLCYDFIKERKTKLELPLHGISELFYWFCLCEFRNLCDLLQRALLCDVAEYLYDIFVETCLNLESRKFMYKIYRIQMWLLPSGICSISLTLLWELHLLLRVT